MPSKVNHDPVFDFMLLAVIDYWLKANMFPFLVDSITNYYW